jgi:hypothetical protein
MASSKLTSDLTLNIEKFDPKNVTQETKDMNGKLIEIAKSGPKWYEVCVSSSFSCSV